eukprot:scaffold368_cov125-Cylindrotheca_fusiformis.AAC.10
MPTMQTEAGSEPLVESIPEEDPSQDTIDMLLNSEMNALSLEQRGKLLDDIHGVSNEIDETPELVSSCLSQLDLDLQAIRNKQAYSFAYSLDPQYVKKRELRLRFLRAESFDTNRAASRMVKHFEVKMELFGKAKLVEDITQDDLSKEDIECLNSGYTQILPVRDQAGRGLRCLYYTVMVFTENEEVQKKGVVSVVYLVGSHIDRQSAWAEPRLMSSLPLLEKAIHMCYDNPFIRPLVTLAQLAVGTFTRVRTYEECVHGLKTYGIPTYSLPFDDDGRPNRAHHKQFWEKRHQHERRNSIHGKVVFPGPFDVLVGRGRLCQDHIGNVRYRFLVERYKEQYDQASNFDKTAMAFMIIKMVKESSGRFLKDNGDGWIEVDDDKVRAKVSHSFRTLRYGQGASKMRNAFTS